MNRSKSEHIEPSWEGSDFTCPHCNIHTEQEWHYIRYVGDSLANKGRFSTHTENPSDLYKIFKLLDVPVRSVKPNKGWTCIETKENEIAWSGNEIRFKQHSATIGVCKCAKCKNTSIWLTHTDEISSNPVMLYPDNALLVAPLPEGANDLVSKLYNQAAAVYSRSPIATLALLRMTIEELCKDLLKGKVKTKGVSLDKMIGLMKQEFNLDESVIDALDLVRLNGNDANHEPGKIILDDKMNPDAFFLFVRHAVEEAITKKEKIKRELEAAKAKISKNKPST